MRRISPAAKARLPRKAPAVIPALALALALAAGQAAGSPPAPPGAVTGIPVALLVDFNSGRTLYARAPDRRFPPASTAKVMTAYVAFAEMAQGRLSRQRQFTVRDATARAWNGRGAGLSLKGGTRLDTDTLLHAIATASANDAAVVLAEGHAGDVARWCRLMNDQARRLGMHGSHFASPNGWFDRGATYVTARDLVTLGEALVIRYPAEYRRYFGQRQMTWNGITRQSHDPAIGVVAGADGIKTGYTAEAGYHFLGSAERGGRRLIMVIAGAGSEDQRAAASRALLAWGFAAWQARPLFRKGSVIAAARVQGGDARAVPLVADRAVAAVMPQGAAGPIGLRVIYQGPLVAPITRGARVAELEIRSGEGGTSRLPLFAAKSVSKAGIFGWIANGVAGFFP
ncbi:MAG: D-alanyl-D-alanine carboxypeptidase [Novosphingobium sp.]|jgi:D-alanyl-D-alanine carboxypeptidase (penicillin-binding protein 5/6)|nr:D-alanyl-D-alanine carboxypeptidase [Novosphingobium sp.]